MQNSFTYFLLLLAFSGITGPYCLMAQGSRSAWFVEDIPAAGLINPSYVPESRLYVSLPVKSTFSFGFDSPFSFDDLTAKWPEGDSLYIDREQLLSTLRNRNFFNFELYNELLLIGGNIKRHNVNLSIAKVFFARFAFDDDLIRLMLYGNGSPGLIGETVSVKNNMLNITSFHQFALGYSYAFSEKIRAGMRVNYLNGAFNIRMRKGVFDLYTGAGEGYPLTVASDIDLFTSSTISDFDNMIDQVERYRWFDLSSNHGYAVDLGVQYQPTEKWRVSASATGLGSIKWKENIKNYYSGQPGADFTFTGLDIAGLVVNGSVTDTFNILDTLQQHFALVRTDGFYRSPLNTKVYLGGSYRISEKDRIGLLLRTELMTGRIQPSVTIGYSKDVAKYVSLLATYSAIQRSYTNFGIGAVVRVGFFQAYMLADMVYPLFVPEKAKNYNIHAGISFHFGRTVSDDESIEIEGRSQGLGDD